MDAGKIGKCISLRIAASNCQSALKGGKALEEIPKDWSVPVVFAFQTQGPEFDPLETTFFKVGYDGVCLQSLSRNAETEGSLGLFSWLGSPT